MLSGALFGRQSISGEAWLVQVQAWENRCAFLPDGVEGFWIQAKHFQDRGSHLSGFHKAVNGVGLGAGIRNQKHHIGVIPSETTMLGLLLEVSGVDRADVWNHYDVGCTRVAPFP
jgi:hypothetical protein